MKQRNKTFYKATGAWAAGLLLTLSVNAFADASSKADKFINQALAAKKANGWASVIVRLNGAYKAEHQAQLKALGGYVYRDLSIIQSLAVRVPNKNLAKLAQMPFVARLSSDEMVQKNDEFTVGHSGANVAWSLGLRGSGVTVAVVDSGILSHTDLGGKNGRVIANANFSPDQKNGSDACGHGTHVAGIVAGNGALSTGSNFTRSFYGVAPQTNIANVRVLDRVGKGTVSNVISGIQWAINNRTLHNIRVMNLSLGHPVGESYTTDPLCLAVEQAWKAGIVVVCAAGNNGRINATATAGMDNEGYGTAYGSVQSPGNSPYVITVGAMKTLDRNRANDKIATYSSRGPSRLDYVMKPDIVAPGNQVISLVSGYSYLLDSLSPANLVSFSQYAIYNGTSKDYYRLSGTSMAAPVAAAAAALMIQANPALTPDTVKARLMISADKWTNADGTGDPCTYGAGYLNIPAALNSTIIAEGPALSPVLTTDADGNVYVDTTRAIWGNKAIWGTGVSDLRAIWGNKAIWGSSENILEASRAIWGSTVWADRAIWGNAGDAVDLSAVAINGEGADPYAVGTSSSSTTTSSAKTTGADK